MPYQRLVYSQLNQNGKNPKVPPHTMIYEIYRIPMTTSPVRVSKLKLFFSTGDFWRTRQKPLEILKVKRSSITFILYGVFDIKWSFNRSLIVHFLNAAWTILWKKEKKILLHKFLEYLLSAHASVFYACHCQK